MQFPLVSVCIQTYQHGKFISAAIHSVLSQETDYFFEIIIGEDESTDGTREICQEFARKFPEKIRLFLRSGSEKIFINGKMTGRFNFLENLKAARGKYIALLDGDDCWLDKMKLQKMTDFFCKNPAIAICTHPYIKQLPGGKIMIPQSEFWPGTEAVFPGNSILKSFFTAMSASMLRKTDVENLPEWFYRVPLIDLPLMIYLSQFGAIGYIPDIRTKYNIHKGGGWSGTRSPGNQIKLWHLYSVIAPEFNSEYRAVLEKRREETGTELIIFFRTHFWHKSEWLKKSLEENRFASDRILLKLYVKNKNWNEYMKNLYFGAKEIVRMFIQPFR